MGITGLTQLIKKKTTKYYYYRGYYIRAHVLMNLLNELEKRDNMWGLSSILSIFRNEFNKFSNTGARMSDSIHYMALRLL